MRLVLAEGRIHRIIRRITRLFGQGDVHVMHLVRVRGRVSVRVRVRVRVRVSARVSVKVRVRVRVTVTVRVKVRVRVRRPRYVPCAVTHRETVSGVRRLSWPGRRWPG